MPQSEKDNAVQQLAINTVRTLSMDAVQAAESGHPGTPMALAPLAYALYMRHVRHNPADPHWPDRDRVILSAGHASMLIYSMLHLSGYERDHPRRSAFVRHLHHLRAGEMPEELRSEVRARGHSARRVIELARLCFRQRDEVLDAFHRH